MAGARIIVDTGPLVGFLDADDQWHDWSVARFNELPGPYLTCEAVISEASYLLGAQGDDKLLEMVEAGVLEVVALLPREASKLRQVMKRHAGRVQYADACLLRLSELHPAARVVTTDTRDFRIYRHNRSERLPLICP
ncbi:MAG TPA: PIN domain-containing protein [Lacunisphaera sp.]|nr:PIN domain-containing protein [Lacunisphaera sp.]